MSPGLAPDGASCRFEKDEVVALDLQSKPSGVLRVDATGKVTPLAAVPQAATLTGITFDTTGRFGHRLLVIGPPVNNQTVVAAISCDGTESVVATVPVTLEGGVTVAPADFGAFGGQLIAANELDGNIYAISPSGQLSVVVATGVPFGQDTGVESLGFVPADGPGALFLADRITAGTFPGSDHVLRITGEPLAALGLQPGELVGAAEGGGSVVAVRCATTCAARTVIPTAPTPHGEGRLVVAGRSTPGIATTTSAATTSVASTTSATPAAATTTATSVHSADTPAPTKSRSAVGVVVGMVGGVVVLGLVLGLIIRRRRRSSPP
jgi:hypothetical protein